jgi:hypothetical protein
MLFKVRRLSKQLSAFIDWAPSLSLYMTLFHCLDPIILSNYLCKKNELYQLFCVDTLRMQCLFNIILLFVKSSLFFNVDTNILKVLSLERLILMGLELFQIKFHTSRSNDSMEKLQESFRLDSSGLQFIMTS